jgi:hypothetical protein
VELCLHSLSNFHGVVLSMCVHMACFHCSDTQNFISRRTHMCVYVGGVLIRGASSFKEFIWRRLSVCGEGGSFVECALLSYAHVGSQSY